MTAAKITNARISSVLIKGLLIGVHSPNYNEVIFSFI